MGKKRNAKTGRFDKTAMAVQAPEADAIASADYVDWIAKEQEAQRHRRQDEIIQRFVDAHAEAAAGPIPTVVIGARRRRWVVPVLLAVGVVAGGLMGAAAKDRELRPTIHLLNRAVAVIGTRAQVETQALRDANAGLQDANARLMLERGGALQMLEQDQATDRAASHDLRRADRALQYDQSVDRISDRAKTWEALRAVEKAERRLNEQP